MNSAPTFLSEQPHATVICPTARLGCCMFHALLCMQIHTTRGWRCDTYGSHMLSGFQSLALSSSFFFLPALTQQEFPKYLLSTVESVSGTVPYTCYTYTHSKSYSAFLSSSTMYHLTLVHLLKLSLYTLHPCDQDTSYLWGLSTWGVTAKLERNKNCPACTIPGPKAL